MTTRYPSIVRRNVRLAAMLAGVTLALGGCTHTKSPEGSAGRPPVDYRLRHPIVVQETNKSVEIFVGTNRGGLSTAQRSDVAGLAQAWLREGTGVIIVEVPHGTTNARAAEDARREVQSLLLAAGIPPRGVTVRTYQPQDARQLATLRLTYPRITANVGPCGEWPDDIGPSIKNKGYLENGPYHNFGCASQRNLAAMIDNPADLVQPRPEAPAYTQRRTAAFEKYRKGTSTATTYPESDAAKISETGK